MSPTSESSSARRTSAAVVHMTAGIERRVVPRVVSLGWYPGWCTGPCSRTVTARTVRSRARTDRSRARTVRSRTQMSGFQIPDFGVSDVSFETSFL